MIGKSTQRSAFLTSGLHARSGEQLRRAFTAGVASILRATEMQRFDSERTGALYCVENEKNPASVVSKHNLR